MFDAKAEVETRFVSERQLTPELCVTSRGSHSRFVPDVREVGKFHRCASRDTRVSITVFGFELFEFLVAQASVPLARIFDTWRFLEVARFGAAFF